PPGSRRVLHNMSAPPRTVIDHAPGRGRTFGSGMVFSLSKSLTASMPAGWLALLDGAPCALPPREAEAELRRRLHEPARSLPLPAAALVIPEAISDDWKNDDLLSILTVLSKSSDHVYLRDKEPNLASLKPGRRVVLLVASPEVLT